MLADQVCPFSPHENMMQASNVLDPGQFYEFVKKSWIMPIVSTEWDDEESRKRVISYSPLREFTFLDKKIYSNRNNYRKLEDSVSIRRKIKYFSELIVDGCPEIVDNVKKLYLLDIMKVRKNYPNVPHDKLPANLGTVLPSKFYQRPYKEGHEYEAASRILSEYLGDALVIQEIGNFSLFTKPSWFNIYKEIIYSEAFAIPPMGEKRNELIIQQATSEFMFEFLKGKDLPNLGNITVEQISMYRQYNAHKSMQHWIEKCTRMMLDNKNGILEIDQIKDEIITDLRILFSKTDKKLHLVHAMVIEFVGAVISAIMGEIANNLFVMFLNPACKILIKKSLEAQLESSIKKTVYRYDPVRFAFLIKSFNTGFFK